MDNIRCVLHNCTGMTTAFYFLPQLLIVFLCVFWAALH